MNISEENWKRLDSKFGDLIYFIANRISGDSAIASVEDNVSDLQIAAIEAIRGYYKKNKTTEKEKPVSEVLECPLFNKYLKVVLWNLKNKKGAKITKKFSIKPVSLDSFLEKGADIPGDLSSIRDLDHTDFIEILSSKLNSIDKRVLDFIVENPNDAIKNSGEINIEYVREHFSMHHYQTKKSINNIKDVAKSI